ncbi:HAMP domain-containing sensor histidine kinase [Clostridium tertium]|nr:MULTISPECIES: HAMP domain-containing sensor histidine kinase [Clostridium]MBS5307581.1 HAMP domain-containing histidine kinase [Clostridium sp.]MDB1923143.1 HAMP domain-containing sensor histidine kinase [Clostridium tertium]MDB1926715.1 HAMP domain-containing sensor histidine kinase [Clostridium tertium]MDB1931238.1 HAMP domain-containing sensor histidine kinase [Clostridium tertium]MDB1931847.1 HAMP domain-containing sensor histidine kinase [Clostridium tertium]
MHLTKEEERLIEEEFFVQNYEDININGILEVGGWIETIENNKIISVTGEKKDNINDYSLLNFVNFYEDQLKKEEKFFDSKVYKEDDKLYIVKIPNSEFFLTKQLKIKSLGKRVKETIKYSLVIAVVFMVLALWGVHYKYIKKIRDPLNQINLGIEKMSKGNLSVRLDFEGYKEIDSIRDSFNYMVKEIKVANENKDKLEKSKRDMIRDIAHDIKTPITSIMGYSKALNDGTVQDSEEKRIYLDYIYNKTSRLNYLVNELFIFTKLDSVDYKLNIKQKDICEFLREVVALYYGEIEEAEFNLEIDIPEDPIYYEFDAKELERAVCNLIINSLKYNERKTTLFIGINNNEEDIEIIIGDNGIGIKKEILDKVFEEFVRGDISRESSGGSGLGLAITKKIIELHKGTIILNSYEGVGSEFKIILKK